jgi:dihydropteroate synthase
LDPGKLWAKGSPAIMGILNVTPDSFSDGGLYLEPEAAVRRGLALWAEGAVVVDVGGESTRPGALPVPMEEELRRVVPVIRTLASQAPEGLISVDTSKAAVAAEALAAGACLVNDVSAGSDPAMGEVVAAEGAGIVLMHMRGTPQTMQQNTHYAHVVAEVAEFLWQRGERALAWGISRDRIFLDPGIGFGKDLAGNLALLQALPELSALGFGLVLGVSRKSFIGQLTGAPVEARGPGSLAALLPALACPQVLVRVHDVAATWQFLRVAVELKKAWER